MRTYDPSKQTVDSHTEDYIQRARISDPDDERFVQQVMYGAFRYKKLLKIFLSSLYFKHGGETQRSDYTLYMVFGYLPSSACTSSASPTSGRSSSLRSTSR